MIRSIIVGVAIMLWIAIGLVAILFLTEVGGRVMARIFPIGEVEVVDFPRLVLRPTSNQYLVCPTDLCSAVPDFTSKEFEVSAAMLQKQWQAIMDLDSSITLLISSQKKAQLDYVYRTPYWQFPDIITVRFIALGPSRSTLAIYSRSVYGRDDLGANKARVQKWLHAMGQ